MNTGSKAKVRQILDLARAAGRTSLTAPEGKQVCDAYAIAVPREALAGSAAEAASLAAGIGFPVVMKIVSPDILLKTEAGGVVVGVASAEAAARAYEAILSNARRYKAEAAVLGVQVQQMLAGGQEVIVSAVTDPSFGKLVAFGLGGVLVEVLKDITFRLAPATRADALSMLDGIQAAEMLKGVRGGEPVDRDALATLIVNVSQLVSDFPEISEMDLNPVFASKSGAIAADVRIVVDFHPRPARHRPAEADIVKAMNRIMQPKAVAVIGASDEAGKIGNSVMKNLINGGYQGQILPIHPKAAEIMGHKAYKSVKDVPGEIDTAVFAIPAKLVPGALIECGEKGIACVDNGLRLLKPMPADLDAAFRKFIPPFGAAGNPVDITGGEPPITSMNTVRLGLEDEGIHALILGYRHSIATSPMVFARNMVQGIDEMRAKGIVKPVVASLAGDVEVEEAAQHLYEHGIPVYAYSTEIPVAVLGAKYQWARGAGLL